MILDCWTIAIILATLSPGEYGHVLKTPKEGLSTRHELNPTTKLNAEPYSEIHDDVDRDMTTAVYAMPNFRVSDSSAVVSQLFAHFDATSSKVVDQIVASSPSLTLMSSSSASFDISQKISTNYLTPNPSVTVNSVNVESQPQDKISEILETTSKTISFSLPQTILISPSWIDTSKTRLLISKSTEVPFPSSSILSNFQTKTSMLDQSASILRSSHLQRHTSMFDQSASSMDFSTPSSDIETPSLESIMLNMYQTASTLPETWQQTIESSFTMDFIQSSSIVSNMETASQETLQTTTEFGTNALDSVTRTSSILQSTADFVDSEISIWNAKPSILHTPKWTSEVPASKPSSVATSNYEHHTSFGNSLSYTRSSTGYVTATSTAIQPFQGHQEAISWEPNASLNFSATQASIEIQTDDSSMSMAEFVAVSNIASTASKNEKPMQHHMSSSGSHSGTRINLEASSHIRSSSILDSSEWTANELLSRAMETVTRETSSEILQDFQNISTTLIPMISSSVTMTSAKDIKRLVNSTETHRPHSSDMIIFPSSLYVVNTVTRSTDPMVVSPSPWQPIFSQLAVSFSDTAENSLSYHTMRTRLHSSSTSSVRTLRMESIAQSVNRTVSEIYFEDQTSSKTALESTTISFADANSAIEDSLLNVDSSLASYKSTITTRGKRADFATSYLLPAIIDVSSHSSSLKTSALVSETSLSDLKTTVSFAGISTTWPTSKPVSKSSNREALAMLSLSTMPWSHSHTIVSTPSLNATSIHLYASTSPIQVLATASETISAIISSSASRFLRNDQMETSSVDGVPMVITKSVKPESSSTLISSTLTTVSLTLAATPSLNKERHQTKFQSNANYTKAWIISSASDLRNEMQVTSKSPRLQHPFTSVGSSSGSMEVLVPSIDSSPTVATDGFESKLSITKSFVQSETVMATSKLSYLSISSLDEVTSVSAVPSSSVAPENTYIELGSAEYGSGETGNGKINPIDIDIESGDDASASGSGSGNWRLQIGSGSGTDTESGDNSDVDIEIEAGYIALSEHASMLTHLEKGDSGSGDASVDRLNPDAGTVGEAEDGATVHPRAEVELSEGEAQRNSSSSLQDRIAYEKSLQDRNEVELVYLGGCYWCHDNASADSKRTEMFLNAVDTFDFAFLVSRQEDRRNRIMTILHDSNNIINGHAQMAKVHSRKCNCDRTIGGGKFILAGASYSHRLYLNAVVPFYRVHTYDDVNMVLGKFTSHTTN